MHACLEIISEVLWLYEDLGLANTGKIRPTSALEVSPRQSAAGCWAAHSLLIYFSSISTSTKSVNHFYILVPQDIKHIHLHMHFQMCNVRSKMLLRLMKFYYWAIMGSVLPEDHITPYRLFPNDKDKWFWLGKWWQSCQCYSRCLHESAPKLLKPRPFEKSVQLKGLIE